MNDMLNIFKSADFLKAVLSASVIAAIISSALNSLFGFISTRYFKKEDYKNKFYELIINKRLQVYENLLSTVNKLYMLSPSDTDGKIMIHIFYNENLLNNFKAELEDNKNVKLWIGESTGKYVQDLSIYLYNKTAELSKTNEHDKDSKLENIGYNDFQKVRDIRDNIINSMATELRELHNIDSFFKSKEGLFDYSNKNFERYIEYSPKRNE